MIQYVLSRRNQSSISDEFVSGEIRQASSNLPYKIAHSGDAVRQLIRVIQVPGICSPKLARLKNAVQTSDGGIEHLVRRSWP
ncbi:hypothetical protein HQO38_01120 [Rhodococcus fascians]|nr:hypothetical protein [Rhodococcus fascians]MBY4216440.1 hypothetical protein [Rhodococcus fascians]MBY4225214.1 hypothetical protein [Rhodococcus fascians]MBY4230489.1 hypothetical protein [Rhodococcus fascians]MBY4245614.1 hypothetical protein [Rhodococcus fascians]